MESPAIGELRKLLDVFLPIHNVWWTVFGHTISTGLSWLYYLMAGVPILGQVGAYGLAIIVLTIGIKLLLSPLYQLQLSLSRRAVDEQKRIAPELAAVKKKFKNEPEKQQAAMMALYKEHGVNPLGGLMGCLPALLQFPILTAMYYVFLGNAQHHTFIDNFLFVPHLNDQPGHHPLLAGLPIPDLTYLVIPLLAAATTFVQSKMMQQPPNPLATEQEQQSAQMQQSMQVMMPLMIAYFAIVTPAGLGLYWFVSNCVAIIQQYFVTGWGSLRRAPAAPPQLPRVSGGRGDSGRSGKKPRRPKK